MLWKLGQGSRALGKAWGTMRRGLDYTGVLLSPPAACHRALDTTQHLQPQAAFSDDWKAGSPSCNSDDVLPVDLSKNRSSKPSSVSRAFYCAV